MGTRGPKPQSNILKLARGNPGKRALNHDEPELAPLSHAVPKGMKGRAREEWIRLIGELTDKGVLTVADLSAFEQYCELVGEVDTYTKLVRKVGAETAHKLGYSGRLLKLRPQLRIQAGALGLTPTSRSGVKAVKPKGDAGQAAKRQRFFGNRSTG